MAAVVSSKAQPIRKVKPSLLGKIVFPSEGVLIHGSGGQPDAEEFDFSDVFGPTPSSDVSVPTSSPHSGTYLTSITESKESSKWCPPEILVGRDPVVIYSRSHSLVGPSPRPSLARQPSKRIWDETGSGDVGKANDSTSCSIYQENGESVSETPRISFSGSDDSTSDGGGEEVEGKRKPETGCALSEKMGPQDFELLRVVGQGAFGKVFQVRREGTEEIYAMKVMRKDRIMEKKQGDYMKAERDILTKVVHPFIVQLQYSFQTKSKLYLILDFINGGHLFFQLYRQGTFSEDLARVYTAEIVSAVAHLHKYGIIHRDLKPENILLDAEGHVNLTDFGLAKEVDETHPTNSMCGTMEYMAPEIVLAKGHGKAADWWSVGILLYEMLTGQPPFTHNNRQKLQQKIVKDKIKLPSYLSSEAHSILKGLLQKDATRRLGSGVNGSDDIKNHKWFKIINWRKLEAREIQPKFRPEVSGKDCIANFDERWTKMPAQDSPASTPKAGDTDFFRGYTYVAPNILLTLLDEVTLSETQVVYK